MQTYILDLDVLSVRPRVAELAKRNLIEPSGGYGLSRLNRKSIAWKPVLNKETAE